MATFSEITARVAYKLGQQGPRWLWLRILREFKAPTTALGRRFLMLRLCARRGSTKSPPRNSNLLVALYDLQASPVTYDVIWFVVGADLARRRAGAKQIKFVVVPGWEQGFREEYAEYEKVVDRDARRARIFDILLPIMNLLPASAGVTVATDRAEAAQLCTVATAVYPSLYDPAFAIASDKRDVLAAARAGESVAVLESSQNARSHVTRWIETYAKGRKLITVTLRHYNYMPRRNSNLDAWTRLAATLDPQKFVTLFIPDTAQSFAPVPKTLVGHPIASEAAWNVGLRMAFYEAAYLNLGVNCGPLLLCFFNPSVRCVMFKMLTDGVPQTTKSAMRDHGFELGKDLPFAAKFQRWIWEDDTYEVIERETWRMLERIAADDSNNSIAIKPSQP